MHIIFAEGLEDRDYIDQLHRRRRSSSADRAERISARARRRLTGMTADEIRASPASTPRLQPAAIRLNYGIQRCENGGTAARAVCMLPLLTGAWKQLGGGLQLSTSGAFRLDTQALERPDLMHASPLGRAVARRQYVTARPRAHRTERSAGQGPLRLQLQPRRHRAQPERGPARHGARRISLPSSTSSS